MLLLLRIRRGGGGGGGQRGESRGDARCVSCINTEMCVYACVFVYIYMIPNHTTYLSLKKNHDDRAPIHKRLIDTRPLKTVQLPTYLRRRRRRGKGAEMPHIYTCIHTYIYTYIYIRSSQQLQLNQPITCGGGGGGGGGGQRRKIAADVPADLL